MFSEANFLVKTNYNTSKLKDCLDEMKILEQNEKKIITEFKNYAKKYGYEPEWYVGIVGSIEMFFPKGYYRSNESNSSSDDDSSEYTDDEYTTQYMKEMISVEYVKEKYTESIGKKKLSLQPNFLLSNK